jgi:hypothetical protein
MPRANPIPLAAKFGASPPTYADECVRSFAGTVGADDAHRLQIWYLDVNIAGDDHRTKALFQTADAEDRAHDSLIQSRSPVDVGGSLCC